jgi:hypothetical protein
MCTLVRLARVAVHTSRIQLDQLDRQTLLQRCRSRARSHCGSQRQFLFAGAMNLVAAGDFGFGRPQQLGAWTVHRSQLACVQILLTCHAQGMLGSR